MDIFNPQQKNDTDGLWSGTNSYYKYENDNIVKEMHSSSSLIANMYEKDGPSYWTNVNMTAYLTEKKPISGKIFFLLSIALWDEGQKLNVFVRHI